MKKLTLILIALYLGGCAFSAHNKALSNLVACDSANPQNKYVYANILVEDANSANKYELLGSSEKLTAVQKETLRLYLQYYSQCVQTFTSTPDNPFLPTYKGLFADLDIALAGLLSGRLTIGEANKNIFEAKAKFETNLKNHAYQLKSLENQSVSNALQIQRNSAPIVMPPPPPPPPPLLLPRPRLGW
jgi:hypothetical protein